MGELERLFAVTTPKDPVGTTETRRMDFGNVFVLMGVTLSNERSGQTQSLPIST